MPSVMVTHRAHLLLGALLLFGTGCGREPAAPAATSQAPAVAPPTHLGQRVCAECHQKESALWQGSHHQRAMEPADQVVGNFQKASLTYNGVKSTFFTDGNRPMVRTDGPDGQLRDYPIAYTFGVTPLQQYLVALPGGRYQALSLAWDTRPPGPRAASGGSIPVPRREGRPPRRAALDGSGAELELHVRRLPLDQPAEELRRQVATRFDTTWSGDQRVVRGVPWPGSRHVEWARAHPRSGAEGRELKGLVFSMKDSLGWPWALPPAGPSPSARPRCRRVPRSRRAPAAMHAAATGQWTTYEHGRSNAETHRVVAARGGPV